MMLKQSACFSHAQRATPGSECLAFPASLVLHFAQPGVLTPFDGAESGASEEGVGNGGSSYRLVRVGQIGILRIP